MVYTGAGYVYYALINYGNLFFGYGGWGIYLASALVNIVVKKKRLVVECGDRTET